MLKKQDIREYSDHELSLQVFNLEGLYLERNEEFFLDYINDLYIYRPDQLAQLMIDLHEDDKENNHD